MKELERGVTGFNAEGMYTHHDEKVLLTLVTRGETIKLRQIVSSIDKNAFMFSCSVSEAMGQGFMPMSEKQKEKKSKKIKTSKQMEESSLSTEKLIEENHVSTVKQIEEPVLDNEKQIEE